MSKQPGRSWYGLSAGALFLMGVVGTVWLLGAPQRTVLYRSADCGQGGCRFTGSDFWVSGMLSNPGFSMTVGNPAYVDLEFHTQEADQAILIPHILAGPDSVWSSGSGEALTHVDKLLPLANATETLDALSIEWLRKSLQRADTLSVRLFGGAHVVFIGLDPSDMGVQTYFDEVYVQNHGFSGWLSPRADSVVLDFRPQPDLLITLAGDSLIVDGQRIDAKEVTIGIQEHAIVAIMLRPHRPVWVRFSRFGSYDPDLNAVTGFWARGFRHAHFARIGAAELVVGAHRETVSYLHDFAITGTDTYYLIAPDEDQELSARTNTARIYDGSVIDPRWTEYPGLLLGAVFAALLGAIGRLLFILIQPQPPRAAPNG